MNDARVIFAVAAEANDALFGIALMTLRRNCSRPGRSASRSPISARRSRPPIDRSSRRGGPLMLTICKPSWITPVRAAFAVVSSISTISLRKR
jgi:hypothetical protein